MFLEKVARPRSVYALVVLLAIAIGVGLRVNAIGAGFASDDYMEYAMLKGVYPVARSPFDLFNFSNGSPQEVAALREYGTIPWWSHDRFRLAMMRPLSSALIVVDHKLFGSNLVAFHLHSLLWWAFLVFCTALVLHRLFSWPIAAVAVVLFSIDESHTLPVTWLANRGAMVSLSLGILGLWAHLGWRQGRGLAFALLSAGSFGLALLAGEWTFPVMAYVLAFELLGARDPWRRRVFALIPIGLLTAAFLAFQRVLNYSSLNSNVYINPLEEPWTFLFEALRRIPWFFADLLLGIPTQWIRTGSPLRNIVLSLDIFSPSVWRLIPDWHVWHVLIGYAAGFIAFITIRWGMRERSEQERRAISWLLLGSLLSLVPLVGSFASSRSSLPAILGVSAACSFVLSRAIGILRVSLSQRPRRWPREALLAVFFIGYIHVANASLRSFVDVSGRASFHKKVEKWIDQAPIDDRHVAKQDVFFINGSEHTTLFFGPFVRYFLGRPMPRSWRVLNAAPRAQDIYRRAPNVLEISVLGGSLMAGDLEVFYRAARFPLKLGDSVSLREFTAKISYVRNGKPQWAQFIFDKPLEDPSYLFLRFSKTGLERFYPPPVGKSVRLPRPILPKLKKK